MDTHTRISNLSKRCGEDWQALPAHLRYTPDVWTLGLSATVSQMRTTVYLSVLQCQFHIHCMLEKCDPQYGAMLLQASAELLTTVLQLGNFRDRAVWLRYDFSSLVGVNGSRWDEEYQLM